MIHNPLAITAIGAVAKWALWKLPGDDQRERGTRRLFNSSRARPSNFRNPFFASLTPTAQTR